MNYIGKRKPIDPQSDLQDLSTSSRISDLVECKKCELAKKLFISVNQQSFSTLMVKSFRKPTRLETSNSSGDEGNSSPQKCTQQGFQGFSKLKEVQLNQKKERLETAIPKAGQLVKVFEEAFSKCSSHQVVDQLRTLNMYLLQALQKGCKDSLETTSSLSSASSEEIAVAILTLSSKKARISKSCFVDLVHEFWPTNKEAILAKNSSYFVLVSLLNSQQSTSTCK